MSNGNPGTEGARRFQQLLSNRSGFGDARHERAMLMGPALAASPRSAVQSILASPVVVRQREPRLPSSGRIRLKEAGCLKQFPRKVAGGR